MASTAILAIRIISDATQAAKGLDQTSAKATRMGKVSKAAGVAFAAGLAAVAVAAVKAGNAAAADEAAASKLANTLKNAAGATTAQVAATEAWITAQGKALGVSDDELRPALAKLVAVTKDVGEAQKLAALAMDVSAGSGKSLESVSAALAKAQAGNLGGLAKLGVATKDATGKTKSLEAITKDLANTYKGAASTAAETTAGKQKRLQVAMGELQEEIGARLIPVMASLATAGLAVVEWMDKNQGAALALGITVGTLVGVMAAAAVVTKVVTAATVLWTAITKTVAAATIVWRNAQLALNLAIMANPVGVIIIAVIALVAVIVLAYKKSETFRNIVNAVGKAGAAAFGWVIDKAKALVGWVKDTLPKAFGVFKTIATTYLAIVTAPWRVLIGVIKDVVGWIKDKLPAAFETLKAGASRVGSALLAPFQALKDLIDKILGAIRNIKLPSLPDLNPFGRASTGLVLAGGGMGTTVNHITVEGFVGNEDLLVEKIDTAMSRIRRRYGA